MQVLLSYLVGLGTQSSRRFNSRAFPNADMSRSTACEESNYYETMSQIKSEADTDAKKNGRQNSEEAMDFSNKKKRVTRCPRSMNLLK